MTSKSCADTKEGRTATVVYSVDMPEPLEPQTRGTFVARSIVTHKP